MQVSFTAVMTAVIVVGLGALLFTRGRWSAPLWLVLASLVVTYPFSRMALDRAEDAPDGWLGWLFRLSCGWVLAALLAPLYHWLRKESPERTEQADASQEPREADAPHSLT